MDSLFLNPVSFFSFFASPFIEERREERVQPPIHKDKERENGVNAKQLCPLLLNINHIPDKPTRVAIFSPAKKNKNEMSGPSTIHLSVIHQPWRYFSQCLVACLATAILAWYSLASRWIEKNKPMTCLPMVVNSSLFSIFRLCCARPCLHDSTTTSNKQTWERDRDVFAIVFYIMLLLNRGMP